MHDSVRILPKHDPIVLTDGFTLVPNENRPIIGSDQDEIWVNAGKHLEDGGDVTKFTGKLICQKCESGVAFPENVQTYTDLEQLGSDEIHVIPPFPSGILTI